MAQDYGDIERASWMLVDAIRRLDLKNVLGVDIVELDIRPPCGCPKMRWSHWRTYFHPTAGRNVCWTCHKHCYPDKKWRMPAPRGALSFPAESGGELSLSLRT